MGLGKVIWVGVGSAALLVAAHGLQAQDRNDRSHWRYVKIEDGRDKSVVVETETGAIERHLEEDGRPVSPAVVQADDLAIQKFIHDPAMQDKQRKNGDHDEKSAIELLNLMPQAFVWKVESEGPETTTLSYAPNPRFEPPDMEARVMGSMTGTLVVANEGHHIKSFRGRLANDVTIGFGLLARIKTGSTFDIERRQVVPGYWEITETHVHISGHALFFKTIGEQEDEVKSDFTLVPLGTTLEQAVGLLKGSAK
jgi:hypothetical protein